VPEVILDGAGVLAVICEFEAGRVAKHVGMDWHAQPGRVAGTGDELAEGRGGHWRAAFGDKNVGRFGPAGIFWGLGLHPQVAMA